MSVAPGGCEGGVNAERTSGHAVRVCLASALYRPAVGGEERHTELLAGALTRAGHSVCVATQRIAGARRRETTDGVRIERAIRPISFGPCFGPSYVATLGWFLLRHRGAFDILQATYLYWDAVVAALLKPVLGSRLVVRIVMGGPGGDAERFRGMRFWPLTSRFDGATLRRLVALVIRRGDAFIALNAETRAELLELGASPRSATWSPMGSRWNGLRELRHPSSARALGAWCVWRGWPSKKATTSCSGPCRRSGQPLGRSPSHSSATVRSGLPSNRWRRHSEWPRPFGLEGSCRMWRRISQALRRSFCPPGMKACRWPCSRRWPPGFRWWPVPFRGIVRLCETGWMASWSRPRTPRPWPQGS